MSNNLTRKGLAATTGLALTVTAFVGVAPAQAGTGDVTISPDSGSTWAVFNSDNFEFDTFYRNGLTTTDSNSDSANAWELTNTDGQAFQVELADGFNYYESTDNDTNTNAAADTAADEDYYIYYLAYDARGVEVTSGSYKTWEGGSAANGNGYETTFVVDFDALNATRVVLYSPEAEQNSNNVSLALDAVVATNDNSPDISGGYNYAWYGDGDFSVGVQAWRELSAVRNYKTVDANYASGAQTLNFYDPAAVTASVRIDRFIDDDEDYWLNEYDDYMSFSVGFSKRVNFDQIDLGDWDYEQFENGDSIETDDLGNDYEYLSGTSELDDIDRVYVIADDDYLEVAGNAYRVAVSFDASGSRVFTSGGYTVPGKATDATDIEVTPVDTVNAAVRNDNDELYALRAGTKAFAYTAQLVDNAGDAVAEAGVTVAVVVSSEDYLAPGATITVTSANATIAALGTQVVATGVTNAKGQWSFTVTNSSAIATEGYDIEAYYADEDGYMDSGWSYDLDYQTGAPSIIEADASLVSGPSITLNFTVTDQFGQPVSVSGTKALNVELAANDETDLLKTAAVTAGKVSFTFPNYLAAGQTDVLTASVFTGSAAAPAYLNISELVSIYNTPAAAGVSVPVSQSTAVSYGDFITGTASATNVAPAAGDATIYTGSVVDANGAGIAGAAVTVAGAGFQFRKYNSGTGAGTGDYFKDSITVTADTNGQFSVQYWVHEANATGKTVTATSGGKSASTTVKSYLPENLTGANLHFSWTLPANVVKNTTYAVVAKLTDKWGNPVSTAGSGTAGVTFQGSGSVEINSSTAAVARNFGKDGTATVFLRSVKDIAGPGEISATLGLATYGTTWDGSSTSTDALSGLGTIATNDATTAWDETKWSSELSASIEVLDSSAGIAKVNVGSFNGKLVVYANNYNGKRISWKVGGNWGSAVATSNFARFDRPTPRRGVDVVVEIYVDGVKQLTKTVRTR